MKPMMARAAPMDMMMMMVLSPPPLLLRWPREL